LKCIAGFATNPLPSFLDWTKNYLGYFGYIHLQKQIGPAIICFTTIFVLHEAPHETNSVFELFPYEWNKTSAFVHKPNPETSESKKKSFQENQ